MDDDVREALAGFAERQNHLAATLAALAERVVKLEDWAMGASEDGRRLFTGARAEEDGQEPLQEPTPGEPLPLDEVASGARDVPMSFRLAGPGEQGRGRFAGEAIGGGGDREVIAPGAFSTPADVPLTINWGPRIGTAHVRPGRDGLVIEVRPVSYGPDPGGLGEIKSVRPDDDG